MLQILFYGHLKFIEQTLVSYKFQREVYPGKKSLFKLTWDFDVFQDEFFTSSYETSRNINMAISNDKHVYIENRYRPN